MSIFILLDKNKNVICNCTGLTESQVSGVIVLGQMNNYDIPITAPLLFRKTSDDRKQYPEIETGITYLAQEIDTSENIKITKWALLI